MTDPKQCPTCGSKDLRRHEIRENGHVWWSCNQCGTQGKETDD